MQDVTNSDMDRVLLGKTKDVKEWQQVNTVHSLIRHSIKNCVKKSIDGNTYLKMSIYRKTLKITYWDIERSS